MRRKTNGQLRICDHAQGGKIRVPQHSGGVEISDIEKVYGNKFLPCLIITIF
jgi:hypothetical protein